MLLDPVAPLPVVVEPPDTLELLEEAVCGDGSLNMRSALMVADLFRSLHYQVGLHHQCLLLALLLEVQHPHYQAAANLLHLHRAD